MNKNTTNFFKVVYKDARMYSTVSLGVNFTANIYLFKVNNRSTRKRCEICSKFTIKTPERRQLVSFFKRRGVNFNYLSRRGRGESEKSKKGLEVWSMVLRQVFLKGRGGWHFSYLIFSRFIIFNLEITFCKIVLCI